MREVRFSAGNKNGLHLLMFRLKDCLISDLNDCDLLNRY